MMTAVKMQVSLGPAQETLLIPLYGRAVETRKPNGLIRDPLAVEIVDRLDYNFAKWDRARSLAGTALRTRMFDEDVQAFLAEHPTGLVVELGCGLNTRFERIDNGRARWLDIDLPDAIELRRALFDIHPRRTMIAADLASPVCLAGLQEIGGPLCFVSEGVLMYLDPPQAERTLARLASTFPGSGLVMDTIPSSMRDNQHRHDAMKHLPQTSWFRWACDDPRDIERFGWRLERSRTFFDAGAELVRCLPWTLRILVRYFRWLPLRDVHGYRLNLFRARP
jgi:O-methyltransferase involved in polyketide biosynthesis